MATDSAHPPTTFIRPTDRELVATRQFDAPRDLVFACLTSPEHLPHWMLGPEGWTMPVCEVDLRPGGGWRYVWRRGDGTEMGMAGTYREVERPDRLVATETWGGDWPETVNTTVLAETDGRTTLTTTVLYPSQEAREAATATGMLEGWSTGCDRLTTPADAGPRGAMKYLCLVCSEPPTEEVSEAAAAAHLEAYREYTDSLREAGHFVGCNRLQPPETAITVRVRDGRMSTVDGPFAETKEQLGGYFLIEARDLNEAIQVAARIPAARHGCVEVRPVAEDPETLRALGLAPAEAGAEA